MTELRGVVFDLDGTLVDTTYVHTVAWWQALHQHRHHVSMAAIHRAVGMPGDRLLNQVLGTDRDHADDDAIAAAERAVFRTWEGRIPPTPGAGLLVRWCRDMGLRVAVASSSAKGDLALLLAALSQPEFDAVVTGEDVGTGKPDPDILSTALSRAELQVGEALLVGDAVWDIEAARRIGMASVGLECGGTSAAELNAAGATATFKDPHALVCALHTVLGDEVAKADWATSLASVSSARMTQLTQGARYR